MKEETFNPTDYCFFWTDGWYVWNKEQGKREALQARNDRAKHLRGLGHTVTCYSLKDQLIKKVGLGYSAPVVEFFTTVYKLTYTELEKE